MGNCSYCGKSAGLLRNEHEECKERFQRGIRQMNALVSSTITQGKDVNALDENLRNIAKSHFINPSQTRKFLISGWEQAVDTALDDGILTEEEESRLTAMKDRFSLTQDDLDRNGTYTRLAQAGVLRDILEGKLPKRVKVVGNFPFNFQKDEQLVWIFQSVKYYEEKTHREFVGGSAGVSIRIAKGVYFRTSAFKGHPVQKTETIHVDTGTLAVTDKHIYFAGSSKSFRISYKKIVSFQPFSDGLGVQRDAATAKPGLFVTEDGWFIYNLVSNLAQR